MKYKRNIRVKFINGKKKGHKYKQIINKNKTKKKGNDKFQGWIFFVSQTVCLNKNSNMVFPLGFLSLTNKIYYSGVAIKLIK